MPLCVKKGSLKFPKETDTPVIMVGPGTGVAPFRSALQERTAEGKTGEIFCLFCSFDKFLRSPSPPTPVSAPILLLSERAVFRLPLRIQRLLLQVRLGGDDEGWTSDPLHCLLTRPGETHTL